MGGSGTNQQETASEVLGPKHGPHVLERLGRSIVKRPWHFIGFWLAIVLVCMYVVVVSGSPFTNSAPSSLPSTDASVIAQNKLSAEFPNAASPPSSSIVLLVGSDITGPAGKNATLAAAQAIQSDPRIEYLGGVESLYSAYAEELSIQAAVGVGVLEQALSSTPSLSSALNETTQMVWGPAAAYSQAWTRIASSLPSGTNLSRADWPAYVETKETLNTSQLEEQILSTFYYGNNGTDTGFNQTVTPACFQSLNVTPCADTAMRTTFPSLLPMLFPNETARALPLLVSQNLGISNMTDWNDVKAVGATFLGEEAGLPSSFMMMLWQAFPEGVASTSSIMTWSLEVTDQLPFNQLPLPVPPGLLSSFVSKGDTATMVVITFTKPDNYTEGGNTPVFQDLSLISTDISNAMQSSAAYSGISYYQTGDAPVDATVTDTLNSLLGTLLLITVVLLAVAMVAYFRAPATPLVTFSGIGISVVVAIAALGVESTYITPVASMMEAVVLIFLLAIVTDYSIFMMARYKEELVEGRSSFEAVVSSVRWAGQSIITSGLTVFATGIAMSLSGLGFLKMLGIALAICVIVSIFMALTVIPAVLTLSGPKVFWPYTGERFYKHAERRRHRVETGKTYFSRAGNTVTRHPVVVILVILLISAPIVFVALNVPVSYDTTKLGLPSSDSAQKGLTILEQQFGQSVASSSFVLITFSQPLFNGSSANTKELGDVDSLANLMNSTPGVSQVSSLVGPGGAPMSEWLNLSSLPPGPKVSLMAVEATYVGKDGETVQFQVTTNSSGYSASGGNAFGTLQSRIGSFESERPEITAAYYGGAAQTTRDAEALTTHVTEWMLIGVAIAILIVLLLMLGTAIVPVLALGAIGLSILWAWAMIYIVVNLLEGITLLYLLPLILIILVLGLGMDYNALLLTRVKEERLKAGDDSVAIKRAITHVGGVVTAASFILGGPFLILGVLTPVGLIAGLGLGIGIATLVQSLVAQTYLIPAILTIGKDKVWWGIGSKKTKSDGAGPSSKES